MTKTEQLKLIDKAYSRLCGCCEHTTKWDRFISLITQEEKEHRKFCPSFVQCGLTLKQAVRHYAVAKIFERWVPNGTGEVMTPLPRDFFSLRSSIFGACAIADICEEEILAEFKLPEMVFWLASVDYVKLNEDPRFPREAKVAA